MYNFLLTVACSWIRLTSTLAISISTGDWAITLGRWERGWEQIFSQSYTCMFLFYNNILMYIYIYFFCYIEWINDCIIISSFYNKLLWIFVFFISTSRDPYSDLSSEIILNKRKYLYKNAVCNVFKCTSSDFILHIHDL